jgi:hypothetical protein
MDKLIIFTNHFGGLSICVPTGEIPIEQVQTKDIPEGIESFITPADVLPNADYDFRNAWEQTNGTVTVNLNKAKELTKKRLRIERAPLLIEQDIAFQRALETNANTETIIEEKQRLRHLPELADQCQSIEELRALTAKK